MQFNNCSKTAEDCKGASVLVNVQLYQSITVSLLNQNFTHWSDRDFIITSEKSLLVIFSSMSSRHTTPNHDMSPAMFHCSMHILFFQLFFAVAYLKSGSWAARHVTQVKQRKSWRMSCDVGEVTLPSLYLHHSSFSNPSVASPTSQFILQPFFCFSYVTSSSLNSPDEPPMLHGNFVELSIALHFHHFVLQMHFSTWLPSLLYKTRDGQKNH